MEELSEVGGWQVVQRFGKNFEMDALRDGEPVEVFEDGSNVFAGVSTGEQTGSRVLDVLDPVEESGE